MLKIRGEMKSDTTNNNKQNSHIIIITMLDPATDVDLVAGASVSVANVSRCQCLWLPVPQLPVSRLPGTSVASASASVAGTSASVASVLAACT